MNATGRIKLIGVWLLCTVALAAVHIGLCILVPPLGVWTYVYLLTILEVLEGAGLPTLKGSPDGWPVPTQVGRIIFYALWFALSAAVALAILAVSRRFLTAPRNDLTNR